MVKVGKIGNSSKGRQSLQEEVRMVSHMDEKGFGVNVSFARTETIIVRG